MRRRLDDILAWILGLAAIAGSIHKTHAATVTGTVRDSGVGQVPIANARVTLFTPDLTSFHETRSDATGRYQIAGVSPGAYRLGACALRFEYREVPAVVTSAGLEQDFDLGPETESGRWEIIGNTLPELFDATDIGLLLADGRVFYCHDTVDPIVFDPVTGVKSFPAGSFSEQGCMNGSLLADGRIIMVGGQEGSDPGSFRNAVRWVKTYTPSSNSWQALPDLRNPAGRWYPGMARLSDGSFLAMGGGQRPDAQRTATCERFDLSSRTWSYTGSMLNPTEFPPCALLHTGEVLMTWWPPQLYNPTSGQWRATGQFVQPQRVWPGHSDHSIVVLADGRVLAVGVRRGPNNNTVMGEIYDPATETWSLTSIPGLLRQQAEVVQLPDGRVLVAGGETEAAPPPVPTVLGVVKWCDLYDPDADAWRRVADLSWFREYHAVTLLVPDGRVLTTGGTRIKFQFGPTSADIEAYVPPYLLRGVRPRIVSISTTDAARGCRVELTVAPIMQITSVVLMGVQSTTHWVDAGVPRRLVPAASQSGEAVSFTLPDDPNVLPLGHYMVFAMVDDIPSQAVIIRVRAEPLRGDVNGDGLVDARDMGPFVEVLLDPSEADACRRRSADVNGDSQLDGADVAAILGLLL